jgi:hypothetical protein
MIISRGGELRWKDDGLSTHATKSSQRHRILSSQGEKTLDRGGGYIGKNKPWFWRWALTTDYNMEVQLSHVIIDYGIWSLPVDDATSLACRSVQRGWARCLGCMM